MFIFKDIGSNIGFVNLLIGTRPLLRQQRSQNNELPAAPNNVYKV